MKAVIFAVLALCLASTHAAYVNLADTVIQSVEVVEGSISAKAHDVSVQISIKYEETIIQPVVRMETSVNSIEERKLESEECVNKEMNEVENIIPNLESSLDMCAQSATEASVALSKEIFSVSTEIGFELMALVKGVRKCSLYSNSTLKRICYTNQLIQAKLLLDKSENAAVSVNKSFNETLPEIVMDLERCSVAAEQTAQSKVANINSNIDSCIAIMA